MEAADLAEIELSRGVRDSGARSLLTGRRALVAPCPRRGAKYEIEDGEHIELFVARGRRALDGDGPVFDDPWPCRQILPFADTEIAPTTLDDLILTKPWTMRAKDSVDLELLEALRRRPPRGLNPLEGEDEAARTAIDAGRSVFPCQAPRPT